MPAEELTPVGRPCGLPSGQVGKRNPPVRHKAPGIAGQHGSGRHVHVRRDERRGRCARLTEHPFHVGSDREPARPPGCVADRQARDPDRVCRRHEHHQVERDAVRLVFEPAVARAVPCAVECRWVMDGRGRRAPQLAGLVVADVEGIARPVRDGIVRPGRQLVLATVLRPCVAAAFGRDLESERRIGNDVDPRRRRHLPRTLQDDVFLAVGAEPAESVEELQGLR